MKLCRAYKYMVSAMLAIVGTACSTTSRLGEGEVLYTGVKKIEISAPDTVEVPDAVVAEIKSMVNVPANNSLYSPYLRHPFPLGLWLYNHWSEDSKGLKGWIYRKFVEQPVLMSDVRPDLRMSMIEDMLDKNGFFGSSATYELKYDRRNAKKARVSYRIALPVPKRLSEIRLLSDTTELSKLINNYAWLDDYLKVGEIFCTDSLADVRNKIADRLRNRGYYFFRPEYLMFDADSTIAKGGIVLQMTYADNIPAKALRKYYVGDITTKVLLNKGWGFPDTTATEKGMVIQMRPSKLRKDLIPSCIMMRKGALMRVRSLSATQSFLSRLGIFSSISVDVAPMDSVRSDTLDVGISCRFDTPLETQFEVNLTSKSNSYLGPGLSYGITNRNLFGGGERLTVKLDGSYEWQIGKIDEGQSRSKFNSYELGLNAELAFPRLLAPKFLKTSRRELNWTKISLGGDIMNRPHFFRMVQFNAGINYDWLANRYSRNQVTLFELKYNKLLKTTADFEATMDENPSIAQSFQDQFIPKAGYTYTFDRSFGKRRNRHLTLQAAVVEGGNLFSGLWGLAGSNGVKRLFGTPFSQFIKGTLQMVYSHTLGGDNAVVGRIYAGAAHAYGNSSEVPYTEQFYIGGANSLRAFAVRSVGPGNYRSESMGNGYYDQTGTLRFEMNLEYRFPIVGMLKGAAFVDAGNIWLLKDDPLRPGGKIDGSRFFRDLALGTGVGLRFDMGMIVVRGDLGIGLHLPYDNGRSGYYNMKSFGNSLAFNLAIGYPF